ncbi:fibronectin type III domain-containing protein [Patescibacteria group bacterium]
MKSRNYGFEKIKYAIKTTVFLAAFFGFNYVASATTYYVDSSIVDTNTESATPDFATYDPVTFSVGTGSSSVFKTVADINAFSGLQPGDSILFRRGQIWREQLVVPASGANGNVVTFGAFGSGSRPRITSTQVISGNPDIFDVYSEYGSNDNGDFEDWTGNIPTNWLTATGGSSASSQESSTKQEGSYSVKLTKDGSENMILYRNMAHKTGMRYRVRFYARGENGGEEIGLRMRHFSGGVVDCQTSVDVDNFHNTWTTSQVQSETYILTTEWQEFTFDFQVETPSNQVRFEVNTSDAVVYLDNLVAYSRWTPHDSLLNTYGIHLDGTGESNVEILKDASTRLNSLIQEYPLNLSNYEFTYSDSGTGVWVYWYKDSDGNPSGSGVSLEMATGIVTVNTNSKNYLNFNNLEIYGARSNYPSHSAVFSIENSDNVVLENSKVYLSKRHNISSRNSTNIVISNNETYSGGSWCIDASLNSDGVSISDNIVHSCGNVKQDNNDGHGVGVNTASNVIIEGNNVYANGYGGGDDNGNMRQAIVAWAADDCVIRNNNIHDNYRGGIGIQASGGSSGDSNDVYGNLVYNNGIGDSSSGNIDHVGISVSANSGDLLNTNIYNNTICGNDFSNSSSDYSGSIQLKSGNSSQVSVAVKNNAIFNNVEDYDLHRITWSGGIISPTLSYNNYFRLDSQDIIYWESVKNWNTYHLLEGNELSSLNQNSLFTSSSPTQDSDFQLQYRSPIIDAGTDVGLTTDYAGNPIYGTPDIGAYEYQPPYIMGTHDVDTLGDVRVYGDGKFRNTVATGGTTANLSVDPASDDKSQFLDIDISTWETTGDHSKEWTETSTNITGNTVHTVGDLKSNTYYNVSVDSVIGQNITGSNCTAGACLSNGSGEISFTYSGGYSTHTFTVEEMETETEEVDELEVYKVKHKTTKDSIIIEWKTTNNANEIVRYGKDKRMNHTKKNTKKTKDHQMTIKNLDPDTTYYFRIKSEDRYDQEDRSRTYKVKTKKEKVTQSQDPTTQATLISVIKKEKKKEEKESEEKITEKEQELPEEKAATRTREEKKKDESLDETQDREEEELSWLQRLLDFLFGWMK